MPGKDGTGPLGQGPRAGRGAGLGAGGGAGRCRGQGRGNGLRGRGRTPASELEPLRQKEAELEKELAVTRKQIQELGRKAAPELP